MDVSNYSGYLTVADIEAFKAEGIRFLVAETQQPILCEQQLAAARAGGLDVAAYIYLYFDNLFRPRLDTAIAICTRVSPPLMLWLDVEDETSKKTWDEVIALLRDAGQMCDAAGVPIGIYTGSGAWQALTGMTEGFKDVPLWNAQWTGKPDFEGFFGYGGWREETVRQYRGDVMLAGVKVDMNVRRKRQ